MALRWPDKDPDEQLDYTVDWSRYLDTLTIASVAWRFVQSDGTESSSLSASDTFNGLTVNRITNTSTTATIVLSGGTANIDNKLICEITTSTSTKTNAAIVTKRVINLRVRERK
jgi:phospholipase C